LLREELSLLYFFEKKIRALAASRIKVLVASFNKIWSRRFKETKFGEGFCKRILSEL
jgi:hypothetical protein